MTRTLAISAEMIEKLRTLRRMQKISARQLAEKVTALGFPVSRTQLANYENGRIDTLPLDFVVLAAEALGTTAVALLSGPAACPTCNGNPPPGFTCNTCHAIHHPALQE